MNNASDIAKYIVTFFQQAGDPVTNLKLQKLLYYVQGWHAATYGQQAYPQRLEAWIHGPVQPGVYGEYKHYRWNPIADEVGVPALDESVKRITDEVIAVYGTDSGYELERRTHTEAPWIEARGGIPRDQESNANISVETMKSYFKSLQN